MKTIVNIKLNKIAKRLAENQKLTVEFKEPVIDAIVAACTRAETGARNIDAIVDKTLAPQISSKLLAFMAESKTPTKLTISKGKDGEFKYKFI